MNPPQCALLFDGVFASAVTGQCQCLELQELNMSENDIGDSVIKLAQGLEYLTELRSLFLSHTFRNAAQCTILFREFIRIGKVLKGQTAPQNNLKIEMLDIDLET